MEADRLTGPARTRPILAAVSALWSHELNLDPRPIVRWMRARPEAVLLAVGVVLRVVAYLWNRPMWLDENALRGNVVGVPILRFSAPLWQDQLAPMGFLIVERALSTFVGSRYYVLRFPPLAAGIVSLFLFGRLASRLLPRRAALVALVLFVFSDDLIYYASEFKPYALDVAFGLAITLGSIATLGRSPSSRMVVWMALLLGAAPWFSFASAFVIAGCGMVILLDAALAGRWRSASIWLALALGWLADFAVSYRASQAMLNPHTTTMYLFWDFAFLPLRFPPTAAGLARTGALLMENFVNPLNLLTPGGTPFGIALPILLFLAGGIAMGRRSWRAFALLTAPIALAIAASVARYFPFHGRLILELVPAVFLLIAEATEWFGRRFAGRGGLAYRTLLLALLTFPAWDACYNLTGPRHRGFNIHGDLHPNVFIDVFHPPTSKADRARPGR